MKRVLLISLIVFLVNSEEILEQNLGGARPKKNVIEAPPPALKKDVSLKDDLDVGLKDAEKGGIHSVGRIDPNRPGFRPRRPKRLSDGAFLLLFTIIVFFQVGLYVWKKHHHRSYMITTMVGLVCFPLYICIKLVYWRMLISLAWFLSSSGYFYYKARERPPQGETPKKIYWWFNGIFRVCNTLVLVGYCLVLIECFGVGLIVRIDFMNFGIMLLFYGIYFGLLGRDSAEICCDLLANSFGYTSKSGMPIRSAPANACSLCQKSLLPTKKAGEDIIPEPTLKLSCNHVMHDACVRGWVMVGKKRHLSCLPRKSRFK